MRIYVQKHGSGQNTYAVRGKEEEKITKRSVETWLKENHIPYNKIWAEPVSGGRAKVYFKAPSGILENSDVFNKWVAKQDAIAQRKQVVSEPVHTATGETVPSTATGIEQADYSKPSQVNIKKEYTPQEAYNLGVISYREAQQSQKGGLLYTIPESDVKKAKELQGKWGSYAKVSPGLSAFETFADYESLSGGRPVADILYEADIGKRVTKGLTKEESESLQTSIFDPGQSLGFLEEKTSANLKVLGQDDMRFAPQSRDPIALIGSWAVDVGTGLGRQVEMFIKPAQWKITKNFITELTSEQKLNVAGSYGGAILKSIESNPGEFIGKTAITVGVTAGLGKVVSTGIGKLKGTQIKPTTSIGQSKINQLVKGDKAISMGKGEAVTKIGTGKKAITVKSEVYSKGVAQRISPKITQGQTSYAIKTTQIAKGGKVVGKPTSTLAVTDDVLYGKSVYESMGSSLGKYISGTKKTIGTKITSGRLGSAFKQVKLWETQKGATSVSGYASAGKTATTVGEKLSTKGIFGARSIVKSVDITGMGSSGSGSSGIGMTFKPFGSSTGSVISNIAKSTAETMAKNLYKTKATPTYQIGLSAGMGMTSRILTSRSTLDVVKHSPARAELTTKSLGQVGLDTKTVKATEQTGKVAQEIGISLDTKQKTATLQSLSLKSVQDTRQKVATLQTETIVSERMFQMPSQLNMSLMDVAQAQSQKSKSATGLKFRTIQPVSAPPLSIPVVPHPGRGGFGLPGGFGMDVGGFAKRKKRGRPWWYYEITNPVAMPVDLLGSSKRKGRK